MFGARILSHSQSETARDVSSGAKSGQPIPMAPLSSSAGVTRILPLRMVARDVLLDITRFEGVASFDDGHGITIDDLNAWLPSRASKFGRLIS